VQEAVKNTQYDRLKDERGKAPGLLGWWPAKACTFVDNHDTGSTQQVGGRLVGGLAAGHRR
jgi:alpha-amylase